MKYILLFAVIFILLYGLYEAKKNKDIFNPVLIFIAPIFFSLLTNLFYYDKKFQVSSGTYAVYFVSVICFVIGLIFGERLKLVGTERTIRKKEITYNRNLYKLYWVLAIIGIIFSLGHIIKGQRYAAYGNGISNIIRNMRYYTHYVEGVTGLEKYGIVFADTIMLWLLYRVFILKDFQRRTCILLAVIIGIYSIYVTMDFSRTEILYEFIVILYFYTKKHEDITTSNKKKYRWIIIVVVLILVMFCIFEFIAHKTGKAVGRSGESWWAFYLGSQFYVFDRKVLNFQGRFYGMTSLGILGRIPYKLGFMSMKTLQNMENYAAMAVMTGTDTAVASFASGPYLDYGIIGSVLVMMFYGLAIGYIHKRCLQARGVWIIIYSTCISHCILAFYAFTFGGSNQVYDLILLFLMCNIRMTCKGDVKIKVPLL